MKKIIKKKSSIIVTILLTLFWLYAVHNYLKSEDFTFTTLDGRYDAKMLEFSRVYEMHKDDFVTGVFKSKYQNLGIVSVRFNTFARINDDILRFRLKDIESNDWYYSADYKTDQFQNNKLFPFGFPLIANSKDKTYLFEIVSTKGEKDNAIALDGNFPSFVSRHVYTKEALTADPKKLIYFVFNKAFSIVSDQGVLINSLVYFMPLFYFLIFRGFGFSPMIPTTIIFLSVLIDVLFSQTNKGFLPIAIAFGWILPVVKFKINNKVSATIGLVLLSIMPLFWFFKVEFYAEKFAIWAFIFFAIATCQQIVEQFIEIKRQLSIKTLFRNLYVEWRNSLKFIYYVATGEIVITTEYVDSVDDDAKKLIALIIYRLGAPMAKTYINTTKLIAFTIIVLVKILIFSYQNGPTIILTWLLWLNFYKVQGYRHFYQDFYLSNQQEFFWQATGKYLAYSLGVFFVAFLVLQYKKSLRNKLILACFLLLFNYQTGIVIFNRTTDYKYNIFLWNIKPKKATLWDEVKVTGRNFREMPFKGKVYVNGVEHMVLSWKDREIVFQADPTKTKTGEIKVVDYYGKESSNTYYLDYYDLQTGELIK